MRRLKGLRIANPRYSRVQLCATSRRQFLVVLARIDAIVELLFPGSQQRQDDEAAAHGQGQFEKQNHEATLDALATNENSFPFGMNAETRNPPNNAARRSRNPWSAALRAAAVHLQPKRTNSPDIPRPVHRLRPGVPRSRGCSFAALRPLRSWRETNPVSTASFRPSRSETGAPAENGSGLRNLGRSFG